MKERPILFNGPMVRSLLAGTKLQTRRGFNERMKKLMRAAAALGEVSHFIDEGRMQPNDVNYVLSFCPYGQTGDRLWVRETFVQGWPHDDNGCPDQFDEEGSERAQTTWYRATSPDLEWCTDGENTEPTPWRPSIHMPRASSRILLEITDVRVERLQYISEADCRAEGAHGGHGSIPGYAYSATPLEHFQHIWKSTGGDWAENPWVWVVEFKRIEKEAPCSE